MSQSLWASMLMDEAYSGPIKGRPDTFDHAMSSSRSSPALESLAATPSSSRRASLCGTAAAAGPPGGPLSPVANPCWALDTTAMFCSPIVVTNAALPPAMQQQTFPILAESNGRFGGYSWPRVATPPVVTSIWNRSARRAPPRSSW